MAVECKNQKWKEREGKRKKKRKKWKLRAPGNWGALSTPKSSSQFESFSFDKDCIMQELSVPLLHEYSTFLVLVRADRDNVAREIFRTALTIAKLSNPVADSRATSRPLCDLHRASQPKPPSRVYRNDTADGRRRICLEERTIHHQGEVGRPEPEVEELLIAILTGHQRHVTLRSPPPTLCLSSELEHAGSEKLWQNALENGPRIRSVVPATEEEARRVIERMDAEKCC
nr:acyl-coenzyme A thioesterase 9, mitochondrial-like [Ipomoea batatas]